MITKPRPSGTLLIPITVDGPATVQVSGASLVAKCEHHVTVFGSAIARRIEAASLADPALASRLAGLAARFAWNVASEDLFFHLREPDGDGVLETLIVRLASPPPAHVTLYTSDPAGHRGIGLDREADLEDAIKRGRGGGIGLCAYALGDDGVSPELYAVCRRMRISE